MVAAGRAGDEAGSGAGGDYSDCVVGAAALLSVLLRTHPRLGCCLAAAMAAVVRALQCLRQEIASYK
jgi:hypothetical protein